MPDLVIPDLGFAPSVLPSGSPCAWPVQACGPLPEADSDEYEPLRASVAEVLWALSGRQYGCCEITVRPCQDDCSDGCLPPAGAWNSGLQWTPVLSNGVWTNVTCRAHNGRCSCPAVSEVRLPGPVCAVLEVVVDGGVVPTGSYRVDDGEWLVRTDGERWPSCQAQSLALTEVGTWGVRYSRGIAVPPGGQRSLGEMMSEMWKACSGDTTCCLPKRVIASARAGLQGIDPMEFLREGKTGLYFTDLWLSAVNPQHRPSGARVVSVDYDPGRVTTWP